MSIHVVDRHSRRAESTNAGRSVQSRRASSGRSWSRGSIVTARSAIHETHTFHTTTAILTSWWATRPCPDRPARGRRDVNVGNTCNARKVVQADVVGKISSSPLSPSRTLSQAEAEARGSQSGSRTRWPRSPIRVTRPCRSRDPSAESDPAELCGAAPEAAIRDRRGSRGRAQ